VGIIALGANSPNAPAQQAATPPTPPETSAPPDKKESELPAQIELLETRLRFEVNGDSRKEVHTTVHINNELGAHQFARILFDYNRSFQQIEFPLLRITHAGGGTAEILPSAVTDQPNPAVVDAPAYQDVRVKSVRLLGLAPGDTIEYRVITTTAKHPLAPDFWLDHTFDRSGIVSQELFEIDLPALLDTDAQAANGAPPAQEIFPQGYKPTRARIYSAPDAPAKSRELTGEGDSARVMYRWHNVSRTVASSATGPISGKVPERTDRVGDVAVTTFRSWQEIATLLGTRLSPNAQGSSSPIMHKELELTHRAQNKLTEAEAIYDFVSKKIRTVDLPIGSTGFRLRKPEEVLSSGYATTEDKVGLFSALYRFAYGNFRPVLVPAVNEPQGELPRPSLLGQILLAIREAKQEFYTQLNLEVAPFGVVQPHLRGRPALNGYQAPGRSPVWAKVPVGLPFDSFQRVNVETTLGVDGNLDTKVGYSLRGDNELTLRLAFHQSGRDQWLEVAQLLALADGFRGKITHVNASDPYSTRQPFSVEYEIAQPKFVDWSKRPVRIPALLPQIALPDLPGRASTNAKSGSIDLGTPLAVETHLTLHLPPGTTAQAPTGTAVVRDYAKFESRYDATGQTVTAQRHLSFLERTIPTDRAADYKAFLRAVQNDEAQEFTLQRNEADTAADPKPSTTAPKPPK
jgi:uncharacterized protein DUF3857